MVMNNRERQKHTLQLEQKAVSSLNAPAMAETLRLEHNPTMNTTSAKSPDPIVSMPSITAPLPTDMRVSSFSRPATRRKMKPVNPTLIRQPLMPAQLRYQPNQKRSTQRRQNNIVKQSRNTQRRQELRKKTLEEERLARLAKAEKNRLAAQQKGRENEAVAKRRKEAARAQEIIQQAQRNINAKQREANENQLERVTPAKEEEFKNILNTAHRKATARNFNSKLNEAEREANAIVQPDSQSGVVRSRVAEIEKKTNPLIIKSFFHKGGRRKTMKKK
jgi:hypothetical protein